MCGHIWHIQFSFTIQKKDHQQKIIHKVIHRAEESCFWERGPAVGMSVLYTVLDGAGLDQHMSVKDYLSTVTPACFSLQEVQNSSASRRPQFVGLRKQVHV